MKIITQLYEVRNLTTKEIQTLIEVAGKENIYLPSLKKGKQNGRFSN
jgi:hypothetical protein